MSGFLKINFPSFAYADSGNMDENGDLHLIFTVYDRQSKEYHFPFVQHVPLGNDGQPDQAQTYFYITSNLNTCQDNLLKGVIGEKQTVEYVAAQQKSASDKLAEQAKTSNTSTSSTSDSTVNHGSVA